MHPSYTVPPQQRFLEKVNMDGPVPAHIEGLGPCWTWTGFKHKGYGKLTVRHSKTQRWCSSFAHRLSWEWFYGPVPNRLFVLHKCDNPACVNPIHLFLGTTKENMQDLTSKGRKPDQHGENHSRAKLTWQQVRLIRKLHADGTRQAELAREFRVDPSGINHIIHGRLWKRGMG